MWTYYIGDFKNHSFQGNGILILSTGEKYVGPFINGKPHGKGVFYKINGKSI